MAHFILVEDDLGLTVIQIIAFGLGQSVTLSTQHTGSSDVTEYPIEETVGGISVISDNVRPLPETLSLEVFSSSHPIRYDPIFNNGGYRPFKLNLPTPYDPTGVGAPAIGTLGFATRAAVNAIEGRLFPPMITAVLYTFDNYDPVVDTFVLLEDIRKSGKLVRVLTPLKAYDNMVIVNLNATRSAQEGSGAKFQIDFKHIEKVQTQFVLAPKPIEPRGQPGQNKGAQPPKDEDPEVAKAKVKTFILSLAENYLPSLVK